MQVTFFNGHPNESHYSIVDPASVIQKYFQNFESLCKDEKWEHIVTQGEQALVAAKATGRIQDEAKICAQLTSTSFYQGNYPQALIYAQRCHELSGEFTDPTLFIRALYLESAVYRALAVKQASSAEQQSFYQRAVAIAREALQIYSERNVGNKNLEGKVLFNLGAAHADNPDGNLEEAAKDYFLASQCFADVNAFEDLARTNIRLGKVKLLQKDYVSVQRIIDETRAYTLPERIIMHLEYLEAQQKLALGDLQAAIKTARNGLARAENLGAKEDEVRLKKLIQSIGEAQDLSI